MCPENKTPKILWDLIYKQITQFQPDEQPKC